MKYLYKQPSNQGHGKMSYLFEANADEWNLIRDAMIYLSRNTPKALTEFVPIRHRIKQIAAAIVTNVPKSKKRELYVTTEE